MSSRPAIAPIREPSTNACTMGGLLPTSNTSAPRSKTSLASMSSETSLYPITEIRVAPWAFAKEAGILYAG